MCRAIEKFCINGEINMNATLFLILLSAFSAISVLTEVEIIECK